MIPRIATLTATQKYELLHLLSPGRARPGLGDEDLSLALTTALRRALVISDRIDLPQGFRRRLIEVGVELGLPGEASAYDLMSDEEVARKLLECVFQSAAVLTDTAERARSGSSKADAADFRSFADSFRTMPQDERERWLLDATTAAATAGAAASTETDHPKIDEAVHSHEDTASMLIAEVAAFAFVEATSSPSARAAAARTARILVPRLAGPAGVVAASAFVHGLRKRRRTTDAAKTEKRGESTKERLSPMVRAIVTVCVYLLADDAHRTTEDD